MTKTLIQKNMKLSLEFDRYISGKPGALRQVPQGSEIILTSSSDKKLSDANWSIVRESKSGKFVEAHKSGGSWRIRAVK